MKKKIIISFIGISITTFFVFIPHTFAILDVHLDTPLQVQVTPSQNWIDQETRNSLISTYGVLLVNSCIAVEPYCQNITSTNGSVSACLHFVQLNLAQGIIKGCSTSCPSGYFKLTPNGQCLTPEVGCNNQFGQNSHFIKYDTAGNPQCGSCENGYVWNSTNSLCVISQIQQTPPVTGTLCNGKSWNSCPTGQKFYCPSTGDAQCLIDQPVINNSIVENSVVVKPKVAIPKVESKKLIPVVINKTNPSDIVKIEPKTESVPQTNPTPVNKLKWYQKIFNWFMGK